MISTPHIHFLIHTHTHTHTQRTHTNRDNLSRKVESDTEAKADFNSLKNHFDGIEKDFQTWSKPVAPVDWTHYKNAIEVGGGVYVCVCMFRKVWVYIYV